MFCPLLFLLLSASSPCQSVCCGWAGRAPPNGHSDQAVPLTSSTNSHSALDRLIVSCHRVLPSDHGSKSAVDHQVAAKLPTSPLSPEQNVAEEEARVPALLRSSSLASLPRGDPLRWRSGIPSVSVHQGEDGTLEASPSSASMAQRRRRACFPFSPCSTPSSLRRSDSSCSSSSTGSPMDASPLSPAPRIQLPGVRPCLLPFFCFHSGPLSLHSSLQMHG